MSAVQLLSKDYMDIDEFLASQSLCNGLATLAEQDGGDLSSITDPVDFALSNDQLHEYSTSQIELDCELESSDSPTSSDEGQGKSICSETGSSECSVFDKNSVNSEEVPRVRKKRSRKKLTEDRPEETSSTWKICGTQENHCLATSVEIEGVSYAYNLMSTAKGRKPSRKSVPSSLKDGKYWDRRSKNNEAAKRSRDLRRRKEILVASRAADLEIENEELRAEVTFLKERVKMLNRKLQQRKH